MKFFGLITGIYPGLKGLTGLGRWCYLVIALTFAFCLDLVIFLNGFWVDFIPSGWKKWTLVALFLFWCVLTILSGRLYRAMENRRRLDADGDLYLEAVTHYLKGNWREAASCAKALLRYNQDDVEAMLLLATLYRHTRRLDDAKSMLDRLELLESSDKWFYEIQLEKRELRLLLEEENAGADAEENAEEKSGRIPQPEDESDSEPAPSLRLVRAEDGVSVPVAGAAPAAEPQRLTPAL